MGLKKMNYQLAEKAMNEYEIGKQDLASVFILVAIKRLKANGLMALITQHGWMFQSTYEKLRYEIINENLLNLVHLGTSAFEEISGEVVQAVSFCLRKGDIKKYNTIFISLVDKREKERIFLDKMTTSNIRKVDSFIEIPGLVFAYWLSSNIIMKFSEKEIQNYVTNFQGIIPGKIEFIKLWYEISFKSVEMNFTDSAILEQYSGFLPYVKGGGFRRWYGNYEYVLEWKRNGKDFVRSRTENREYFFKSGIGWSDISTGLFSARYINKGKLFDAAGPMVIPNEDRISFLLMGYMNTIVFQTFININCQGLHYGNGAVVSRPFIMDAKFENDIVKIVKENIIIAQKDWDSFETSWDFDRHPLLPSYESKIYHSRDYNGKIYTYDETENIPSSSLIESAYQSWKKECDTRFNQLKANEEELNRIFIEIYGLQDELTPEVEEKDVTVRRADLQRDIRSLISYAVGCMFGRYSLDVEGLAYAGGEWDNSKYSSFIPDADNVIPITDENYFEDDIVGRFCEWMRIVYGEETLEENLDFVAEALGNKGSSSREIIRNYFLKDFFKDHCKIYQKRPIYWLFDSGKQNGFKALIYLHCYNRDTVGRVRSDYLHKIQDAITGALKNAEYIMETSSSAVDRAKASKSRDKYLKQLNEIRVYYQALSHVALQRMEIDLDDGVKHNYGLFQNIEVSNEDRKRQTVDLLAKI